MKMHKAILELEMPESCWKCKLRTIWGACIVLLGNDTGALIPRKGRRPDCPLKVNKQSDDVKQRLARGGAAFVVACDKTGIFKSATSLIREMFSAMEDTCVICGTYVPEGRMVCSVCEKDPFHVLRKEQDYEKG